MKMSDLNPFKKTTADHPLPEGEPQPEVTAAPEPEPEPKKTYKNMLTIIYKSGFSRQLWQTGWTGTNMLDPWKRFHHWWFKRESDSFWLEWKDGGCMVLREDVQRFEVQLTEEKPKKGKKESK